MFTGVTTVKGTSFTNSDDLYETADETISELRDVENNSDETDSEIMVPAKQSFFFIFKNSYKLQLIYLCKKCIFC